MLKIRDDVDLKELEKFGFEYEEEDGEKYLLLRLRISHLRIQL